MAFWRPSTMDSWNPFSLRFWSFANLFSESKKEQVTRHKNAILARLTPLLENAHPENIINDIYCPLLKGDVEDLTDPMLLQNPLITYDGRIYETSAIDGIFNGTRDCPDDLKEFKKPDFYIFTTLKNIINAFLQRRQLYFQQKNALTESTDRELLINQATQALQKKESPQSIPTIFLCTLSGKPLKDCVITPLGECYSREAIEAYINEHGNHPNRKIIITVNNKNIEYTIPLKKAELQSFDEFQRILNAYKSKHVVLFIEETLRDAGQQISKTATMAGTQAKETWRALTTQTEPHLQALATAASRGYSQASQGVQRLWGQYFATPALPDSEGNCAHASSPS